MRIIDADELLQEIEPELTWKMLAKVNAMIEADAKPVIHGQWISAFDEILCSVCKRSWNYTYNDTNTFNYCPNCEAQMDGGDE